MDISHLPADKKRELLELLEEKRRRKAASSLDDYVRYIYVPGAPISDDEDCDRFYPDKVIPADHHRLILQTMERVITGEITNVMIFMPPGSAKSTYASVVFPTAFMARVPRSNVIQVSYNDTLAKKFARKCRQICRSFEYNELYGAGLVQDNKAVNDWSISNGSTYMCGGVLSGITGNRADLLVVDDPLKGREEADSPVIREKVWEAYLSDLITRLKPGGRQIIILTRWHEDDIAGRILPDDYDGRSGWVTSRTGEPWYVLCLPAQAERDDDPLGRVRGQWLWTDWFPVSHWENLKRVQSVRNWNALYQQRPSPEEGAFFLRDWLRYYTVMPQHMNVYGASDYAVTADGGDYTVHGIFGVDHESNIYVLDWWRGQVSPDVWTERQLMMIRRWKPLEWADEGGLIGKSTAPLINQRMRETGVYCYHKQYPQAKGENKQVRAASMRGRMAQGKVFLPQNAPWCKDLEDELMTFPNGRHDDQVDVMSLCGVMLDRMRDAEVPKQTPHIAPHEYENEPTFEELLDAARSREYL
jgi:predicted phage terminase large subunit-like protein